jgi:uncharacterized protein (TIGR02594 family)
MEDLLLELLRNYGLKEIDGSLSNPEIIAMGKFLGYKIKDDSTTAWCSLCLNFYAKKMGYEYSNKLNARSWLSVGTEVMVLQMGDVVVYWRNRKDSWEGHVGLYISEENGLIWTLGGNQNNGLNISLYNKNRVLGYRKLNKL